MSVNIISTMSDVNDRMRLEQAKNNFRLNQDITIEAYKTAKEKEEKEKGFSIGGIIGKLLGAPSEATYNKLSGTTNKVDEGLFNTQEDRSYNQTLKDRAWMNPTGTLINNAAMAFNLAGGLGGILGAGLGGGAGGLLGNYLENSWDDLFKEDSTEYDVWDTIG